MRILIVDDSVVFRSQIKAAVESSMKVQMLATAANGKIALQKLESEQFDVMTLDMEMPEMNGIETLREIKARNLPIKVVVFAAQNARAATIALQALSLGAIEVVAKPDGGAASLDEALSQVKAQLVPILKMIEGGRASSEAAVATDVMVAKLDANAKSMFPGISAADYPKVRVETFKPKVIVIGSSTGGPNALEVLFANVHAPVCAPILLVQHMPPIFTASLASRIAGITGLPAAEGKNGEVIKPGHIYVAPGDFHMGLFISPAGISIKLSQAPKRCHVRPAVDVLFEDAANIYEKHVGGIILTGMGEDGMLGCRAIKTKGGGVVIQDKETCVVWGMPGAVHAAGAFDKMGPLLDCGRILTEWTKG
jgi:two-component system, chemotaxis family, protein-glutamate methylesterase/glutaminase